jgi:hypothetical protein
MTAQQKGTSPRGGLPGRTGEPHLADLIAARPAEVTRAGQIIAAGGRSNDACLRARQFLERAVGADPARVFTAAEYMQMAHILHGTGRGADGDVLESLAGIDAELQASRPWWDQRYRHRAQTAAERDADAQIRAGTVIERGQPGHGTDGAWYTRAYYPRTGRPAVVVTTSAMTEEIVPFASTQAADTWLASRAPGARGPLMTTTTGPVTRCGREEEILAWMLREPGAIRATASLASDPAWTTHLRAELFAALRWLDPGSGEAPEPDAVLGAFGRRLLRAPGWAAADIGWPDADRALAYVQRLAVTPVTTAQAYAAGQALAAAGTITAQPAGPVAFPGGLPQPGPSGTKPGQAPGGPPRLVPPPSPMPGPAGPVPRM